MWRNQELDVVHKIRIHVFVILLPSIVCLCVLTKAKVSAIEADIIRRTAARDEDIATARNYKVMYAMLTTRMCQ